MKNVILVVMVLFGCSAFAQEHFPSVPWGVSLEEVQKGLGVPDIAGDGYVGYKNDTTMMVYHAEGGVFDTFMVMAPSNMYQSLLAEVYSVYGLPTSKEGPNTFWRTTDGGIILTYNSGKVFLMFKKEN